MNGDLDAVWRKLWEISSDIAEIRSNGCAQRENDLEVIKDLKGQVAWLFRISIITLLGVAGTLVKIIFLPGVKLSP